MNTSVTLYNVVKGCHILFSAAFVGGIFAREAVRSLVMNTDDVQRVRLLQQASARIENVLVKPGSIVLFLLGLLGARIGGIPMLGSLQGHSQNWLFVSLILFLIGFSLVPLVFVPNGKRYRVALNAALQEGRVTDALRAELHRPVVKAAHAYEVVSLIVIIALMTLKPF